MVEHGKKPKPPLREMAIANGYVEPRPIAPPPAAVHRLPARTANLLDFLYESSEVPSGLRAQCHWLLDIAQLCDEAEYFFNKYRGFREKDENDLARFSRLGDKIVVLRKLWLQTALRLNYSPPTTSEAEVFRTYRAMERVLRSEEGMRHTQLRRCVLDFLYAHKSELERQAKAKDFVDEQASGKEMTMRAAAPNRRKRARFVR